MLTIFNHKALSHSFYNLRTVLEEFLVCANPHWSYEIRPFTWLLYPCYIHLLSPFKPVTKLPSCMTIVTLFDLSSIPFWYPVDYNCCYSNLKKFFLTNAKKKYCFYVTSESHCSRWLRCDDAFIMKKMITDIILICKMLSLYVYL